MYQEWPFFRTFLSNVQVFTFHSIQDSRLKIHCQSLEPIILTQPYDFHQGVLKLECHFDIFWGLSQFLSWFDLTKHVTNKISCHLSY